MHRYSALQILLLLLLFGAAGAFDAGISPSELKPGAAQAALWAKPDQPPMPLAALASTESCEDEPPTSVTSRRQHNSARPLRSCCTHCPWVLPDSKTAFPYFAQAPPLA